MLCQCHFPHPTLCHFLLCFSGNVCVKPNEPNADPEDCSKFYLCANGKPHPMSCREGTLFNANVMTCDYPKNVNCDRRLVTPRVNIQSVTEWVDVHHNSVTEEDLAPVPVYNNNKEQTEGMSSEKIAIIVLVFILLAVCLAISFCFRERIKEVAQPYLDHLARDKLKPGSPSALGLLRPYSFTKPSWPSATNKTAQMRYTAPSAPSVLAVRELPPVPIVTTVPVPPPRRKKSVVEIQTGLCHESENTQSIA